MRTNRKRSGSRWGLRPQTPAQGCRGYTVTEVMMALAVLTVGASGVIAMQKATLISNTHARNLTTANGIAQMWMERMRLDALAWNEPGKVPDLAETKWLGDNTLSNGVWTAPPTSALLLQQPAGSAKGDVMGADVFNGDPSPIGFCTQVRLTPLAAQQPLWTYKRMIRVEVRVFWDKTGQPIDCAAAIPTDWHLSRYGFVYLTSAVLENNSPL